MQTFNGEAVGMQVKCADRRTGRGAGNDGGAVMCQRCSRDKASYRVYTDAINMKVCFVCAEEASNLGLFVEVLRN